MNNTMFTLIIQGPTTSITQQIVDSALSENRIEKIIVSHWGTDSVQIYPIDKVELILSNNPYPNNTSVVWNKFNLANQAMTTVNAFNEKISTPYVIKLRSNWPYLDFQKIIDRFLEEPSKILTSNLFFRHTKIHPFHCSDHLIVAESEVIEKAFRNVYHRCVNRDIERTYYASDYYNNPAWPAVEQLICDELLHAKNVSERDNPSEIMKANFKIIVAEELTKGESLPVSSTEANKNCPIIMSIDEI